MSIQLNGQPWTRREVVIWLSALLVAVILGVLFVVDLLGSWVLLVAPVLTFAVVWMRYRADVKRNALGAALFVLLLSGALSSDHQARAAAAEFCSQPSLPVVSPGNVRLRVAPRASTPERGVQLRLENRGTSSVTFGLSYRLARWEAGKWVGLPVGPFFAVKRRLVSGSASECQSIDLAEDAPAGAYRVLKWVSFHQGDERRNKLLRAFFRVA